MLNRAERYRTLKIYRILSIFGIHPIKVDLDSWKLTAPCKIKRWISCLSLGILLFHTLYKNGSLVNAYFFDPNVQLHQLVIHAVLAMASILIIYYAVVYISDPHLFAAYVHLTLLGNVGGPFEENDRVKKQWKIRVWEYSMQDWIVLSLPYMITTLIPFIVIACVYDPSMKLLVYSALPNCLQHWTTFGLFIFEEARIILVMISIGVPIFQVQVISFDLVSLKLRLIVRRIQVGNEGGRNIFMLLRSLQLYISILNKVNGYLIFTFKLVCISIGIIAGFSAVAHFREHPIFGILYYLFLLDALLMYTFMYGKTFEIPKLFDEAKTLALLLLHGQRRGVLRRQILSIPSSGIKVGSFHKFEQASTPIFLDFVLKNIVNLLVTYA